VLVRSSSALFLVMLAVLAITIPAEAQTEEEQAQLDELKAERERIQAEAGAQAVKVDAANADFGEVVHALEAINALVDMQEARLVDAEQVVRSSEAQVAEAARREAEIAEEVLSLQAEVRDLAVASFTGESGANGEDLTALLLSDDPTEAARRRSLVEFQTGSLGDGIDRLRSLVAEAEVVSEKRRDAATAAERGRIEAESRRADLAASQDSQQELVAAAERRLEARLAEAAVLEVRSSYARNIAVQANTTCGRNLLQRVARRQPVLVSPCTNAVSQSTSRTAADR